MSVEERQQESQQQQQQPQRFGALDQIRCPKCGDRMWLTRRSPRDEHYEHQSFLCRSCEHEVQRTVDVEGRAPPDGSAGR
jgi:transposase-like protein